MLVGIFAAISAAMAALVCLGAEAFSGLGWLWMLPVSFVGSFLVLLLLWVVVLIVMAARVRMDEVQLTDDPVYRKVIHLTADAVIFLMRIRIHMEGLEKAPKTGRFLLVCTHLDDTDPVVLLRAFPKSQLAFISKRENDKKFIIGPFLRQIGCQPINRENDREALKTIINCIRMIKEDQASIAVFPEGYVSMDRKLHPFRPGVFRIAQKTQVPIVVCTLRDTYHIFPNMLRLKASDVTLHVLGTIMPEDYNGMNTVQLGEQVHAMMAEDLGPDLVLQP